MAAHKAVSVVFRAPPENRLSVNALCAACEVYPGLENVRMAFAPDDAQFLKELSSASGCLRVGAVPIFSCQAAEASALAASVRRKFGKEVFLLAGGPHSSGSPLETLLAGFDAVCVGEGEETFPEFLSALKSGADFRAVRGLAFISDGEIKFSGRRPPADLDKFSPISFKRERFGSVEISRGCPHGCGFCQVTPLFGNKMRHRSPEAICAIARKLAEKGLCDFRVVTPDALAYGSPDGKKLNLREVESLLKSLHRIFKPAGKIFFGSFPSEVRPEHVTKKSISLIAGYADNDNIVIGAQSGSPRVLELCRRGHTVKDVFRAVKLTREAGLKASVDFIFCLPGETEEDANLSCSAMLSLAREGARIHAHTFMPLAGTAFWRKEKARTLDIYRRAVRELNSKGLVFGDWLRQSRQPGRQEKIS